MRIIHTAGAVLLTVAFAMGDDAPKKPGDGVRVAIVTGVDWKGHFWKETAPALKEIVERNAGFAAAVIEDPNFLASDRLFDHGVLVLHFKNYEPLKGEERAKANLVRFVKEGRGLVVVHYASGAFEGWDEFRNLVGRTQGKRHDKRGPFTVKIVDHEHPITRGLKDLQVDDELFIELAGDRPIEVLATARSQITGQDHPMAFVFNYGVGRVFHTTLGHDVKAITVPDTSEIIRRGVAWAAAGGAPAPAAAR